MSNNNSAAVVTLIATKHVRGKQSTRISARSTTIIMEVEEGRTGKIRFGINMRVPEVFGPYSSLEVSVSIEGDGNIDNFESFNNQLLERAVTWTRGSINEIAVASGGKPFFGQ